MHRSTARTLRDRVGGVLPIELLRMKEKKECGEVMLYVGKGEEGERDHWPMKVR